ncbi:MAG: PmoA family protein [Verrucomicrobiota bacterium]
MPTNRCQLIPQPNQQISFLVDSAERLRWHYGRDYPRPFFYPFIGPTGAGLTRMGHPGAPDHDHHRSIWFAHSSIEGHNFWGDATDARIEQTGWKAYKDGDDEAAMAVTLVWKTTEETLLEQEMIAVMRPLEEQETILELHSTFRAFQRPVTVDQSNFGIIAVRVAKEVTGHFGGGTLTNSEGSEGEKAIFGKYARWMDYSGPEEVGQGITLHDHPKNPGYPAHWHVREDGWMGPSLTRLEKRVLEPDAPIATRYLLHAHAGQVDPEKEKALQDRFARGPGYRAIPCKRPHEAFEIERFES